MPATSRVRLLLMAALLGPVGTGAQNGGSEVWHHLSFPDLKRQYVHVATEFPVSGDQATLVMANWTPGSYLIRDFAANLVQISARGGSGLPLPLVKVRKNTWRVQLHGNRRLRIEYDVHAGDLNVNASWVSPDFVLVNGASVFLYTSKTRGLPQRVEVDLPAGAGQAFTPLPEVAAGGWLAGDFDELIDNPLVISDGTPRRFTQDGHEYRLLHVGNSSLWDEPQAASDVRDIVRATNAFWGTVPLRRDYWFFNFLVEGKGGLEHDHGTVMMTSRWQMRNRDDYIEWLNLVAHEYFHAWNVRRLRPESILRYDYEREQYSSSLWLAEGISSYYDNLLLSRAGLVSPQEYFNRLAIDFHRLELTPGRRFISLEEASRDAWIRHYQPDANSINSTVSYYTKGAVVAFVLDTRIRANTGSRSSLDEVMQRMYETWAGSGYPDHAFSDIVEEVAGAATREWLQPLLSTPADPDIDSALDWYGLELNRKPQGSAAGAAGNTLATGFGVTWDQQAPGLVVKSVVDGLAGAIAGILPGDELLAIAGERLTRDTLEDRMQRLRPGESVELLLARRGRVLSLPLELHEARPATYEIRLKERFGKRQVRRLELWLGQSLEIARP